MKCLQSFGMLVARILIAAIFIWSGVDRLLNWEESYLAIAGKGLPGIPFLLALAVMVEILGGVALIIGFKTRWMASLLILFLIPVAYYFHNFWDVVDMAERNHQIIHFLQDLAIMGGLLSLVCQGPGKYSLDGKCCKEEADQCCCHIKPTQNM